MIIQLSPKYKFVCERCGKEIFPKDDGYLEAGNTYAIAVSIHFRSEDRVPVPVRIEVCKDCRDDFETFWDNFRDVVNKEGKT